MSIISSITSAIQTVASKIVTVVVKYDPIKEASTFSFRTGAMGLATDQENLYESNIKGRAIDQIKIPSETQIKTLENNLWITASIRLAPSNLVIRQLCMIDIFRGKPANAETIEKMVNILSYWNGIERSWAEGYSYWEFTKKILIVWTAKFTAFSSTNNIKNIITYIDNGFKATSYKKGNVYYPALYGDLWEGPLASNLQVDHPVVNKTVGIVKLEIVGGNPKYTITGKPIGLNMHTVVNNFTATVVNGIPNGFKFYLGYGKKYPSQAQEISDMMNPTRLLSVVKLVAGEKIV